MDNIPHEQRFLENLKGLLDLIFELVSNGFEKGLMNVNPSVVEIVKRIVEQLDKKEVIENFIKRSIITDKQGKKICLWDFIIQRNQDCCCRYIDQIFSEIPNICVFGSIIKANWINENDRNAIWEYLDSLIRICLRYICDYNYEEIPEEWVEKFRKHYNMNLSL